VEQLMPSIDQLEVMKKGELIIYKHGSYEKLKIDESRKEQNIEHN
jgi:hypothetical protein